MMVSPNCELPEENHFIFIVNEELPSLQELASFQVALAIWNGYISRCSANQQKIKPYSKPFFEDVFGLYSSYQEDANTLVESLKTPRTIETILKTSLSKVRKEMDQCVRCFFTEILFCHYPKASVISTFKPHWCVWLPNGKIDYLKTAEMMVSPENNEFNLKTKFAIMCEFYMEEKLKKVPLNSLPANFIEKLFRNHVISTRYWVAYLVGKCKEIDAYTMVADSVLKDGIGGIRINHFWHRLSDDDQVKAVYNMLVKRSSIYCEKWQAIEPLIGSMSWDQQSRLLAMPQAAKTIIIFSCLYSSSSKCAVWAWKHCRDFITGHDFSAMIHEIFYLSKLYPSDGVKDVFSAVEDVWDTAYDHHRNILVTECRKLLDGILFPDFFYNSTNFSSATYVLLNKCLALKPTNERKSLIMEFAEQLATGTLDTRYIQEVLDFNVPHPEDQIKFKKSVTNYTEMISHCAELWTYGHFDILKASVEFYCNGDLNSIGEYIQKLLSKIASFGSCGSGDKSILTDNDKWHECCKFIDQISPDDPAKALVAKQQFLSSFLKYDCWSNRFCKRFDQVIKTVVSVFQNKVELNRVKTMLTKAHPTSDDRVWMRKVLCNDVCYHIVIEWCCYDNEEAVIELKNKIQNQDTIFDIVFFQLNKAYLIEVAGLKMEFLTHLDKYLSWYLVSEDEIIDYKMRRLNESDKLAIFTTIREQRDEQSLKMLLGWFFNNDEAKVRDFRSKKMKF